MPPNTNQPQQQPPQPQPAPMSQPYQQPIYQPMQPPQTGEKSPALGIVAMCLAILVFVIFIITAVSDFSLGLITWVIMIISLICGGIARANKMGKKFAIAALIINLCSIVLPFIFGLIIGLIMQRSL
jgi:hypothetical protein